VHSELGADAIGVTHYRVKPGRRVGSADSHGDVEEVYLVLPGSRRFKVDDEIVTVGPGDAIYCPPAVVREWEAG
jgi:mannose-6-phosphate isomerase-like protein (cupin superfamily)